MRRIKLLIASMLCCGVVSAAAQPKMEADPHGAVLCGWAIYVQVQAIGDRCFPNDKSEFSMFLNESIERMDAFIIENAPALREEVETAKANLRSQIVDHHPTLCDASSQNEDPFRVYKHFRAQNLADLRRGIDKALAVPRKPVMNPCF
jgi:hypothetical protein